MKKKIILAISLAMISLSGCGMASGSSGDVDPDMLIEHIKATEDQKAETAMYKFRNASDEEAEKMWERQYAGEWIYDVGEVSGEDEFALFLGKVIACFGMNDSLSSDWENMYSYPIIAENEQGEELLIEIYHGPGGPSYSIPIDLKDDEEKEKYEQAAKALVDHIQSSEPADYELETVYEDIPVNVKYSVKNGVAKAESEFPEGLQ